MASKLMRAAESRHGIRVGDQHERHRNLGSILRRDGNTYRACCLQFRHFATLRHVGGVGQQNRCRKLRNEEPC